jgi:hypothetical protein
MANGATYSIVPFVTKSSRQCRRYRGAGGNALALMAIGFLFGNQMSYATAFLYLGGAVFAVVGLLY